MKVRLTRKLADYIDDVDLRSFQVGDVLNLSNRDAGLLVAEGWAVRDASRRAAQHSADDDCAALPRHSRTR